MSEQEKVAQTEEELKNSEECEAETAEETAKDEAAEEKPEAEAAEETAEETKEEAQDDRYIRLLADYQNLKRRTEKEKADIYQFANEKIVKELLNVTDNFERALGHTDGVDEKFVEGMEMIFKQLMTALTDCGVAEIEALGADFDPNFHNAVMTEASEEYESGKVTAVFQKGYLLNSKVVRPSMVKVAE